MSYWLYIRQEGEEERKYYKDNEADCNRTAPVWELYYSALMEGPQNWHASLLMILDGICFTAGIALLIITNKGLHVGWHGLGMLPRDPLSFSCMPGARPHLANRVHSFSAFSLKVMA